MTSHPENPSDGDVALRVFGPEAAEILAEILAEIHAEAFAGGEVWNAAAFVSLLSLPGTQTIIAERADVPAGFVLLRAIAGECEILTLAVRPAFRRQRIGRKLVCESIKFPQVFLEVSDRNDVAIALYKSFGFCEVGRRRSYYADKSDAIVLSITS